MSDELPGAESGAVNSAESPESLASTRARLELDGPPAPPDSFAPPRAAPAEPADPGAPPVPRPKRIRRPRAPRGSAPAGNRTPRATRRRRPHRIVVIAGAIVILGVAAFAIAHGLTTGLTPHSTLAAWKHYPGTAYGDSADVLAAPSKEQTIAEAESFVADYQQALTQQLGVSWTKQYDASTTRESNGYGGFSLLYDYSSPAWQGTVVLDDTTARRTVFAAFSAAATAHGATDVWLANDVYADDATQSKKEFGGTKPANQPEWGFYGDGAVAKNATVSGRVIDLNVPRAPSFDGDFWFDLDEVPSGSVVVTVSVSADSLLATSDRTEFARRVASYDEKHKPEPH